jgi:hypothetical protein
MKNKKVESISGFQHTLLWMAVRYAMGRQSITSLMLPNQIISNWGHLLAEQHKRLMFRDVIEFVVDQKRFLKEASPEDIEDNTWLKFASWLDETNRYTVEAEKEGKSEASECFLFMGRYYPVKGLDWWMSPEFIKSVERIPYEGKRWAEEVSYIQSRDRDYIAEKMPWLFEDQSHESSQ